MTDDRNNPGLLQRTARHLAIRRTAQRRHFHFYSMCSGWEFCKNVASAPISWRREHWIVGGVMVLLSTVMGIVIPTWANAMRGETIAPSVTKIIIDLPLPSLSPNSTALIPAELAAAETADENWRVITVRSGQSLGDIFAHQGVSATTLQTILDDSSYAKALHRIHPGDEFAFQFNRESQLQALRFDRDEQTRVTLKLSGKTIEQVIEERPIERRLHVTHGVVTHSLFEAGEQAGLNDTMILKLASAFGYDIDFAQDLRKNDSFTVLYDDVYREGERLRDGEIIAATFINQGKHFTAFRYTNSEGETLYYTEDGRPLRKAFLRTPVEFTRITSGFSLGRLHPVLGTMRAHRGVDYGAPSGTPIHAAGAGKILFRGWQSGYGNVVILQHGGHYSTLYGHMSSFSSGQSVGQHISQGETIGYVGMTGLATGPHLHYEFRIDNQHRDPLTVTLPKAEPLPTPELARFQQQTQPLLAKLRLVEAPQLASLKSSSKPKI